MTATSAPTSDRLRPPSDAEAVGWHLTPGDRSAVRWWTGDDWSGPMRPYPVVPPPTRTRVWLVVTLASTCVATFVAFMFVAMRSSWLTWPLLAMSVAAAALAVAELLRSAAAHRLRRRSPGAVGRAGWVQDPAGAHAWRCWDGHRFTPFVADPDPGARDPWSRSLTGVDDGVDASSAPPAPDWAHLAQWASGMGVLALASLVVMFAYVVVTVPAGVLAVWWGIGCVRNARRLACSTPVDAVVGIVLGLLALALVVPMAYMWAAVGSAL